MAIRWEAKRPDEVRDYTHDWTAFLDGDTIATSAVVVTGVTLDSEDNDTTSVTVVLSGGDDGDLATVTNTITTAGGRTETEVFVLQIRAGSEPVSLDTAKAHLRKTTDDEDALICGYIRAAREWVENYTGHILVRRPVTEIFSEFGDRLKLRHRPVSALDSVTYTNSDGDPTAYEGGVLRTFVYPATVYPSANAPFPAPGSDAVITAVYTAGYSEGAVPQVFVQAVLLLVSHSFSTRSAVHVDALHEVPLAVKSLLGPYRVPPLA